MNHMELIFIRTDKNGTKYYHDWKCPRCGGAGFADKWIATGKTCWACGGSGKRAQARIVKEYTPEYWAKLEARRIKKEEKRKAAEPIPDPAEIERKILETIEKRYAEFGCGKDGTGYVITGKTWDLKDQIKAAGGRWIYGRWVCPEEITGEGIQAHKISLAGHIGGGSEMWLDDFDLYDEITKFEIRRY